MLCKDEADESIFVGVMFLVMAGVFFPIKAYILPELEPLQHFITIGALYLAGGLIMKLMYKVVR